MKLFEHVNGWLEAAVVLSTLLSTGVVTKVVMYLRAKRDERRQQAPRNVFQQGFELSQKMNELVKRLKAHRSMIIKAHNSGGDISLSKPLYTSVMHQVTDQKLPQVYWEKEPVDEGYWELLNEVAQLKGRAHVQAISELDPNSMLRHLYESQGVKLAVIFELKSQPEEYWYCSTVLTDMEELPDEDYVLNMCREARAQMVKILFEDQDGS